MKSPFKIDIYTDGACSGNPGAGGWGAILIYGETIKEISGYESQTTNNRMELTAVIEALNALKTECEVTVYSDSAYVVNAFNQDWISTWVNSNWYTKGKKPVDNQDLWKRLLSLMDIHKVNFVKVIGHSNNKFNNECDRLARAEIKKNIR